MQLQVTPPVRALLAAVVLAATAAAPTRPSDAAPQPDPQIIVEPGAGPSPLLALIAGAHRSLDGEVHLIAHPQIAGALEAAAARGVQVRLTLDPEPAPGAPGVQATYRDLAQHGVQLHPGRPPFPLRHGGFLVADGRQLWIGTMDWTTDGLGANRELAVMDRDPAVASLARRVARADWAGTPLADNVFPLVLAPLNARSILGSLILGAQHGLDIYAPSLDDPGLSTSLMAVLRRGTRVRAVVADDAHLAPLQAAGMLVTVLRTPRLHVTAVVADGAMALIAGPLATTSLDRDRALGIVSHDPAVATAVERVFAADLAGGQRPAANTDGSPPTWTPVASAATPTPTPYPTVPRYHVLTVSVSVTPTVVRYGDRPVVTVRTLPGASCTIQLRYSGSAQPPVDLANTAVVADGSGVIVTGWNMLVLADGGTVTATCAFDRASATASASFTIV